MSEQRRKHNPSFKAKVAQLAARYQVRPSQIQVRLSLGLGERQPLKDPVRNQ